MNNQQHRPSLIRIITLTLILIICMAGIWWLINWSLTGALSTVSVVEGNVASQDIMSPYAVSYESQVLITQNQQEAAQQVDPIYTRPDSSYARLQLTHLKDALNFIDTVRNDQFASLEQKYTDLAALEGIFISQDMAEQILGLSDVRWQTVRQESIVILEQVMRNAISEDD